ncbi:glycosyl transferase, partial [Candidatus Shapirobacteria bacterium CG07_land_8_20_14_0_80_39_18]
MKLSVIIPVFNEEKTIEKIVNLVLTEKTPKEI